MNADLLLAQLEREIAAGAFEGSFDRPHHIVVRNNFVRAVISHGEHGAALGHKRGRQLGHANEGMAGNIHRFGEALR